MTGLRQRIRSGVGFARAAVNVCYVSGIAVMLGIAAVLISGLGALHVDKNGVMLWVIIFVCVIALALMHSKRNSLLSLLDNLEGVLAPQKPVQPVPTQYGTTTTSSNTDPSASGETSATVSKPMTQEERRQHLREQRRARSSRQHGGRYVMAGSASESNVAQPQTNAPKDMARALLEKAADSILEPVFMGLIAVPTVFGLGSICAFAWGYGKAAITALSLAVLALILGLVPYYLCRFCILWQFDRVAKAIEAPPQPVEAPLVTSSTPQRR